MFCHRAPARTWAVSGLWAGCGVPPSAGARLFVECGIDILMSGARAAGHPVCRTPAREGSLEPPGFFAGRAIVEHLDQYIRRGPVQRALLPAPRPGACDIRAASRRFLAPEPSTPPAGSPLSLGLPNTGVQRSKSDCGYISILWPSAGAHALKGANKDADEQRPSIRADFPPCKKRRFTAGA